MKGLLKHDDTDRIRAIAAKSVDGLHFILCCKIIDIYLWFSINTSQFYMKILQNAFLYLKIILFC